MIIFDYILGRLRKKDDATPGGGGDMTKAVYDPNDDGIVDNAANLGGQTPSWFVDRSNHSGTQTVATISDFDSKVASNSAVSSNTSKVSADGSVTSHSDVTNSGSGAIITTAERNKLNAITGTNTGNEVQATMTVAGIAEIATEAEVDAETDNLRIVTPLRLAQRLAKKIIYGNNRQYVESEAVSTNTTTVLVNKISANTIALNPAHTYRVEWFAESSTSSSYRRVQINVAIGAIGISDCEHESESGATWQDRSGFREVTGLSGIQTLTMSFARAGAGGSASIQKARVSLIRVA